MAYYADPNSVPRGGEDTVTSAQTRASSAAVDGPDLYQQATDQLTDGAAREDDDEDDQFEDKPSNTTFLQMVREAESQASLYMSQVNKKAWSQVYRAFHNQHFVGSKYASDDYLNRSKLFVPQTRKAVRKDLAAVAASLFGSIDAVSVLPGNEGDAMQRGSAAVIQELVNYRTDRSSGKASIPWFHVALGARQDSVLTGICLSKQSWKLELKRSSSETVTDDETGEERQRDVWTPFIDRPDSELIPPENFVIDAAANWTNPAQDAAYIIIKWPMRIDEIRRKQKDPRQPWNALTESQLRGAGEKGKFDMQAIRRAREQGLDRLGDEQQSDRNFDLIWVYETFIRTAGEDWTFLSVGDKWMLTDPRPVAEVYPEQFGERPLVLGYGSFESHRIFPMSNAASWQPLQLEMNDLRNLSLDAVKQNVMPVTKVVRGRQVDLDQLKRRGQGSSIMVTAKDDVTWERPPDVPASVQAMKQALDIDFDDLAGQQNYGTVENNNALGKTLGGLKLAAGAANAVQEFDIRIWIETWCEPVLAQIVRLEQFYESDPLILGIAGEKAKLMQKYGINEISNELLENQVTLRVNIGLGAGDPQQRLAKFNSAIQVALPLLQMDPDFLSGKKQINGDAVMEEVFGAAGYRDGGSRFVKEGQGKQQDPKQQPEIEKMKSETEKNKALAKKAIIDALSGAAKVGIDIKELELLKIEQEFQMHIDHVDQVGRAHDMGHQHGHAIADRKKAAQGLNPDGTPIQPPAGPDGQPLPDQGGSGAPPVPDLSGIASAMGAPPAPGGI
ncbi:hypothetical protein ABIB86_000442 [Bradyrhizobium sp. JR1.7]|uniref:portal protein n=1 Tax=unclassified Bradyrhizobium TaxID=2631580 RepID=UPI003394AB59